MSVASRNKIISSIEVLTIERKWGKSLHSDTQSKIDGIVIYRDSFTKDNGGVIDEKEWRANVDKYDIFLKTSIIPAIAKVPKMEISGAATTKVYFAWEDGEEDIKWFWIPFLIFDKINFCITGKLAWWTRDEYEKVIKFFGGKLQKACNSNTNYLVVGSSPGQGKKEQADKFNTPVITEDDFKRMLATNKLI